MMWQQIEWNGLQGCWAAVCERFHGRAFLVLPAGPWAEPFGAAPASTGWLAAVVDTARHGDWHLSRTMLLGTAERTRGGAQLDAETWAASAWADRSADGLDRRDAEPEPDAS